jgi:D-3-phosphoglycerate dehydrogenase
VSDEIKPYLPIAESLGMIFVSFAKGLPATMTVRSAGRLAEDPVHPIALAVLKGALSGVSDEPVSYVNAPLIADARGVAVEEVAATESQDYLSLISVTGHVDGMDRSVCGTHMGRKGPVLTEVDGYEIELPITEHMLLVRNEDVPGVIGRVGTYLGETGINIADMAVGRHPKGGAMMGMSLDGPLREDDVDAILALDGVASARYIMLG